MRDTDLVLAGELRERSQDLLDLLREHVYALDLHHVVGTAHDGVDPRIFASARTFTRNDTGHVVRTETDERRALLDQRRNDDLAPLAVRHIFARLRIDDLQIDVIIPVVHAALIVTADTDAGSVDLREAIDIINLDAEFALDAVPHFFAPALGTDHALLQVDLILQALLFDLLGQKKRIGGCRTENRRFHILHELQLFFRIAGSHGDRHGAELFRAVLEADARRPKAVARCDLNTILVGDARRLIAALEHLSPVIHVLRCIRNDDRCPRRSGRRVNADDLLLRYGHQAERIRVAQILFLRKREALKILHCLHLCDAGLLKFPAVKIIGMDQALHLIIHHL